MNKILVLTLTLSLVLLLCFSSGISNNINNIETGDKVDAVINSINNGENLPAITYGDKLNTIINNGV